MNKIIQITDLHLTKPGTRLWGIDPCSRLEACLNDLAQHHADADFCVISGDLTEAGDLEALRYLQKKLDNFPIDTHLMIGNHDNRERFLSTFPDQPTDGNGFIQYAIQTSFADAAQILLDEGYKGPSTKNAPRWLLRILAIFDREARGMLALVGMNLTADNSKTRETFDWTPMPFRQSLIETAVAVQNIRNKEL